MVRSTIIIEYKQLKPRADIQEQATEQKLWSSRFFLPERQKLKDSPQSENAQLSNCINLEPSDYKTDAIQR